MTNEESITNCPNCGSVLAEKEGYLTCAYCGTTIYDFATLDTEKPFYMRVKTIQGVILNKVRCIRADIQIMNLMNCQEYQELIMTFDVLQAGTVGDEDDR